MADPRPLTRRQRLFVEEYLTCWNASEAARRAGYTGKANVIGAKLLANISIKALIEQRLQEKAMPANEVLARLSEQARASVGEFLTIVRRPIAISGDGPEADAVEINWPELLRRGHLVKKITPTRYGFAIELHDAQAALVHIGQHLKLFTQNIDLTSGGKPLARTLTDDELAAIIATEDGGSGTPE